MIQSRERRVCFVLLCVAIVAAIGVYFWATDYSEDLSTIVLTNLILGFLVGGLSRRLWLRLCGWLAGTLLVAIGNVLPLLSGGGKAGAWAIVALIVIYPLGVAVSGAGILLGYFAHPFISRLLANLSKGEENSYQGRRCVACTEPIEAGELLCPKCGWTQPA